MALSDTFTTLGNTIINLVNSRTAHKQNQLVAGDGIQITENTEAKNADICIHPDIEAAFQSVIDELNKEAEVPPENYPVILLEDIADGSATLPEEPFIVSTNMTEIPAVNLEETGGPENLPYAKLRNNKYLVRMDFSNVEHINSYGLSYLTFAAPTDSGCPNLISIDLSNLQSVDEGGMAFSFILRPNLESIKLDNLQSIDADGLASAFATNTPNNALKHVNLSKLESIGENGLNGAFMGNNALTSVDFSSLRNIGKQGLTTTFQYCNSLTSLSFPALNSNSFGSAIDQFRDMLDRTLGCTVHFPSNLESVIGGWNDVTLGFGGTNTTVLFDLPATT